MFFFKKKNIAITIFYWKIHKLHLFCWFNFSGNQKMDFNRAEPTATELIFQTPVSEFPRHTYSRFLYQTTCTQWKGNISARAIVNLKSPFNSLTSKAKRFLSKST